MDWERLAEPQRDGYDTDVALGLAAARGYRRPPPAEPSFLDGAVSFAHVYAGESWSAPLPDAPAEITPAIARADELLARAPVLRAQAKRLLHALHPARYADGSWPTGSSRSHSLGHRFGTMWATTDCPIGLGHSVVHEMAHQKLRALGLGVEDSGTIVGNAPSKKYPSPVMPYPRPMSAVLHATYSFAYVLALDLAWQDEPDGRSRRIMQHAIGKNAARVAEGIGTIRRHAVPVPESGAFLGALGDWVDRLVAESARAAA